MNIKKNILFILTDDQRYNTIHALGNKQIITPNMDKLVENGTAFTHAHIPCGTTGAICMPSRAMLNCGRSLFHIDKEGQNVPLDHTTLGEMFIQNGYHTFGTGKWHNGIDAFQRSFLDGENIFFGGMWDHWNTPTCVYDPSGEYDNVVDVTVDFLHSNRTVKVNSDKFNAGTHSSELLTNSSIRFLQEYDNSKPFFLYLSYLAPHDPRTMPQRFKDLYNIDDINLPPNFLPQHPFPFGVENIRDERLAAYPRDELEVKQHLLEYYAMISHLDYEIGRLIDALKQSGQLDNTIIVLTGDNGLAVGSHGLMGKQNNYDHSLRVPLVFCGAGIPKGKLVDKYVYLFDIFPTLCSLTDCPVPSSVEGIDFSSMITGSSSNTTRDCLYFAYADLVRSVKNQRYKLIKYKSPNRCQLFDLLDDPDEIHDLINDSAYAPVINNLSAKMLEFRDSWGENNHIYGQQFWQ